MEYTTTRKLLQVVVASVLLVGVGVGDLEAAKREFKITPEHVKSLSPEMQREIAALHYMLNPYQIKHFFALPSDGSRSEWIDFYWKALDPTPTTPKNEMKIEHYVRVRLAMEFFSTKAWPGWDKRGEIFIRYGAPNYRGKIHAEVTARKVHPPGELWFYKKHAMIVKFEDFNLNGRFNYAITPLGAAQGMDPELMEFLLYDTDNALQDQIPDYLLNFNRPSEIIADAQVEWTLEHQYVHGAQPESHVQPRMRGMSEGMDEVIDPDYRANLPNNPSYTFHKERINKYANNFEVVLEETPSAYPFNFADNTLPFYFDVDQFKGGEALNRVEANIEFSATLTPGPENLPAKTYMVAAVFYDSEYNEITREDHEIVLPTTAGETADTVRLVPAQLVVTLPKEYYRVAVSVEETNSGRNSAYRSTLAFADYRHDLAISDVLFASKIAPVERQSPFNRGSLEVVPHPLRRYRKADVVPIYFEVYNLEPDEDGISEYTVEYRIVPHSTHKSSFWDLYDDESPIVSSQFESSSYGTTDAVYISVRTDNLWDGAFDLLVTVKDDFTLTSVYRKATFHIVD
jgi:GWxTD domain-containing protein